MIIQHNMMANNANRQTSSTNKSKNVWMERLSSGYKINRAADNAAGLAISEKMRSQIRGLNQAANNIVDGMSLIQVADGALSETHGILHRMRELAIQSANATLTDSDRLAVQYEITALISEVDRIAEDTEFNSGIYPLRGAGTSINDVGSDGELTLYEATIQIVLTNADEFDGVLYPAGSTVTLTGMTTNGGEVRFDGGCYDSRTHSYYSQSNSPKYSVTISDLQTDENGYLYFDSKGDGRQWYYFYKVNDNSPDPIASSRYESSLSYVNGRGYKYFTRVSSNFVMPEEKKDGIWIQSGAGSLQGVHLNLVDASARALGISNISVETSGNASEAIDVIKDAADIVSNYRSYFGAMSNCLNHAYDNVLNESENLQESESKIRDTDMAKAMVENAKLDILQQAGQSMIAQANQINRGILQLLG